MSKEELPDDIEKLRKSEKHYRALLDESMDPTFSFYADGTYRAEARFSHSICQECAKELYPDLELHDD